MRCAAAIDRLVGLRSLTGRFRVLHLTWAAFFLTFMVWFSFAPFAATIGRQLGLDRTELATLALCNVGLTVPARLLVGMALDRWGPRRVYAAILVYAFVPCTVFALATTLPVMVASRLALSVVGGSFVVGIRMVAEWFAPREVGMAEGVYAGWGNAGAAAAALVLPTLAAILGGDDGWRWATGLTGVLALAYGLYYLRAVRDTPDGTPPAAPRRQGALEVTSRAGVAGLVALQVPLVAVLVLLTWRLQRVDALAVPVAWALTGTLVVTLGVQICGILRVNRPAMADVYDEAEGYPFRSVAILSLAYAVTFGSELAVVSMLPTFFGETFGLGVVAAGATASAFAFMNLVSRPVGGLCSDVLGSRRRTLLLLLVGLAAGYGLLATVGPAWPVGLAVAAVMACAFVVQAGSGATYAIVPLVKRRVSGQIAGLVGAYGTAGALVLLTLLLVTGPSTFFAVIGGGALLAALACHWLPEPEGTYAGHVPHAETVAAGCDASFT